MTRALLVMVHGSPRSSANEEMYRVLELLQGRDDYPIVEAGFLECNEPAIPAAIERCIERGADVVVAVPYFLHTGKHVAGDLPGLLEQARERHPEVEFLLAGFLGRSPRITQILADRARSALASSLPPCARGAKERRQSPSPLP